MSDVGLREAAVMYCEFLREAEAANQRFLKVYNELRELGGLKHLDPMHIKQLEHEAVAHRIGFIYRELGMGPEYS